MTQTVEPPATAPGRTITSRWGVGLGLVVLLAGVLLGAGWERSQDVEWMHERATWGTSKVVTIDHDGWSYGARQSIPRWIDEYGVEHDGGWPTCLRGTGSSWIRFAATEVTIEGATTRPIVAVDCRP
jgi:hypothetical protein